MGQEKDDLELEAAKLRVERERLALAREQRSFNRQTNVSSLARDVARGGLTAADHAKGPFLEVVGYVWRVAVWHLIWVAIVAALAVVLLLHARDYAGFPYLGIFGHVLGLTIFFAPPLALIYGFFKWRWESTMPIIVGTTAVLLVGGTVLNLYPPPQDPEQAGSTGNRKTNNGSPPSRQAPTFSRDCESPQSQGAMQLAYAAEVRSIEQHYPALNPDSPRYEPKLEAMVVTQKDNFQKQGHSSCVAARLAADAVMAGR
ncbi:MAG: hypothetical protein U1E02_16705 [Hydrogenophaga sp.]|nr:hypothetical protein [Hydrogenophaga sp.]